MYHPDPHRMAYAIAENSLKEVRANPANLLAEYHDGRCDAVALMYIEPELLAAANEIRFLTGDYKRRHYA